MVQAWYFWAWLWNEGAAGAGVSTVRVWHSRQSRFTLLRRNSLGLLEPCGVWHAMQPSVLMGACSQAKGPALSVWQLKQTMSCEGVARSWDFIKPPCWLWQLEHRAGCAAFSSWRLTFALCTEWQSTQPTLFFKCGERRKLACSSPNSWQLRQRLEDCSRDMLAKRRILSGSPDSACSLPGPWQASQPCHSGPWRLFSAVFQCGPAS